MFDDAELHERVSTLKEATIAAEDARNAGNHAGMYVVGVIVLSAVGVISTMLIVVLRPEKDNASIITTVLGFLLPVVTALLAAAVQQVHVAVNSRLTQLVRLTAKSSAAEATLIEKEKQAPGVVAEVKAEVTKQLEEQHPT